MRPVPAFLLGATLAPLLGSIGRPLVQEAFKGGILIARELRKIAEEIREDVEDERAEDSLRRRERADSA